MWRLIIEWDFGQDRMVFDNISSAANWLDNNKSFQDFLAENDYTIGELMKQRLIDIQSLEVYSIKTDT